MEEKEEEEEETKEPKASMTDRDTHTHSLTQSHCHAHTPTHPHMRSSIYLHKPAHFGLLHGIRDMKLKVLIEVLCRFLHANGMQ